MCISRINVLTLVVPKETQIQTRFTLADIFHFILPSLNSACHLVNWTTFAPPVTLVHRFFLCRFLSGAYIPLFFSIIPIIILTGIREALEDHFQNVVSRVVCCHFFQLHKLYIGFSRSKALPILALPLIADSESHLDLLQTQHVWIKWVLPSGKRQITPLFFILSVPCSEAHRFKMFTVQSFHQCQQISPSRPPISTT